MIRWLANCMSVVFVCDNCLLRGEKNKQRAILITSDFYLKQTATQRKKWNDKNHLQIMETKCMYVDYTISCLDCTRFHRTGTHPERHICWVCIFIWTFHHFIAYAFYISAMRFCELLNCTAIFVCEPKLKRHVHKVELFISEGALKYELQI